MDKIFAIIFNETVMTTRFVWVGILLFNVEIMNSSFLDIEHLSLEGRLYFAQDRMKGMLSEGALPRMQALRPLIDRWLESERTNVWNSHKAANGETATKQRMAKQPQISTSGVKASLSIATYKKESNS